MFDELLELNARAAADRNYETAYHLLMAALHWADHAGDQQALDRLIALAKKQGAAVEAIEPPHQLSRRLAQTRGQTSLYESYLAHVEAVRLRLDSERQRRKHRPAV